MFLPEDKWSRRFDSQFYTMRMKRYVTIGSPSELKRSTPDTDDGDCNDDIDSSSCWMCPGDGRFPAVYYEIEVMRGSETRKCLRRYSEFRQFCKQLDRRLPPPTGSLMKIFPPKTAPSLWYMPGDYGNDEFLEGRMRGLYAFMKEALARQECVNEPLVAQFLALNR